MFGCESWCWSSEFDYELYDYSEPEPFSLPSPLPHWPQGMPLSSFLSSTYTVICCNLFPYLFIILLRNEGFYFLKKNYLHSDGFMSFAKIVFVLISFIFCLFFYFFLVGVIRICSAYACSLFFFFL